MDAIKNPYVLIPVLTWLVAQIIKFAVPAFKRDFGLRRLFELEGRPASQLAAIVSLPVVAFAVHGAGTSAFGITTTVAIYVLYTHFITQRRRVRLEADIAVLKGQERPIVNEELEQVSRNTWLSVGLGILAGLVFTIGYWTEGDAWINRRPGDDESQTYLFIFAGVLLGLTKEGKGKLI